MSDTDKRSAVVLVQPKELMKLPLHPPCLKWLVVKGAHLCVCPDTIWGHICKKTVLLWEHALLTGLWGRTIKYFLSLWYLWLWNISAIGSKIIIVMLSMWQTNSKPEVSHHRLHGLANSARHAWPAPACLLCCYCWCRQSQSNLQRASLQLDKGFRHSAKSPISGYGNQASLLRCVMFKALRVLDFPSRFLWNVNSLQIPHQVPAGSLELLKGKS